MKCANIWRLLEHVFLAHGFRLSDEALPNFEYPKSVTQNQVNLPINLPSSNVNSFIANNIKKQLIKNIENGQHNNSNSTLLNEVNKHKSAKKEFDEKTILINQNNTKAEKAAQILFDQQQQNQSQPLSHLLNSLLTSPQIHQIQQQNSQQGTTVNNNVLVNTFAVKNRLNCRFIIKII